MSATVIVGLQFGDEGKGKIVDWLAGEHDAVIRYNGGANAGHTVENEKGVFKLHLVPSGIFSARKWCAIGNGVVIDAEQLVKELAELDARGVDIGRFRLSPNAHLVMPWHKVADVLAEAARGDGKIGTTGRGIGPCYADKAARTGLRVRDLLDPNGCMKRAVLALQAKEREFRLLHPAADFSLPTASELEQSVLCWFHGLASYVDDVGKAARRLIGSGGSVLLEGAQATMLDIDHGTYPFVSSSYTGAAGACQGSGIPPTAVKRVIGVAKAYATRVGAGPFRTELEDETGERLRKAGHEFGTTTGRPRRCGWFDAATVGESADINGAAEIVLTKLDVLTGLPELRLCGRSASDDRWSTMPGWSEPIAGDRSWDALPKNARDYVKTIESLAGVRVSHVATGPHRDSIIEVP